MTKALYDDIGGGYARRRVPDWRIARRIHQAIDDSRVVANVGAGAGSYEPENCSVIAIEPSWKMIRQRTVAGMVIQAVAERLPLRTASVDAAMAILTIHHWTDWRQGLRELKRVTRRRIVILTWDPSHRGFWLTERYFPTILETDIATFPTIAQITTELGSGEVSEVPVPHDCIDGFLGAYWRRPESYLDPETRSAISAFAVLPQVEEGLRRLKADLDDGTWFSMFGELMSLRQFDVGYRIIAAEAT